MQLQMSKDTHYSIEVNFDNEANETTYSIEEYQCPDANIIETLDQVPTETVEPTARRSKQNKKVNMESHK